MDGKLFTSLFVICYLLYANYSFFVFVHLFPFILLLQYFISYLFIYTINIHIMKFILLFLLLFIINFNMLVVSVCMNVYSAFSCFYPSYSYYILFCIYIVISQQQTAPNTHPKLCRALESLADKIININGNR